MADPFGGEYDRRRTGMNRFDFSSFADPTETFDAAPVAIAVTDASIRRIAYINEAFCLLLGQTKEELTGSAWGSLGGTDGTAFATDSFREFREGKRNQTYEELEYLRPDGSSVWLGITLYRSPGVSGGNFTIGMANDISQAKKQQALLDSRTHDLDKTREALINSMAILSEFRDRETGEHITRTRLYVRLLLDKIPYKLPFSRKAISLIANSAILHDIGKVGIPDQILLKPGKLSPDEFDVMKTHTTLGAHAIMRTQRTMEKDTFLMFAKEIAEFHHEKWDGTGYPLGLRGDQIPLTARVMALADVYDALRSERTYKKAFGHEESLAVIREGAGTHFDPLLTGIFLANQQEILRIASIHKDDLENEIAAFREDVLA
jgi:PAS domain S-box